jgi:drug/metabolite transporter (DMT)-like permease
VNPNAVVVHFSAVATLASLSAFLFFDRRTDGLPFYDPEALVLLLGIGLTASLGQMLLTRAFAAGEPAKVSVVGLSQVVFTLLIDVGVMHHEVAGLALIGTLLIIAPTAWVMLERKPRRIELPNDAELEATVDSATAAS